MTEIEIPKPDVFSAIKMFAKNNYAGTLTGEAFKDLFDLIESQKEEIGRLMAVNQHLEIDLVESKAITELAVKGLLASKTALKWATDYGHLKTCTCAECTALGTVGYILSEIERLSK